MLIAWHFVFLALAIAAVWLPPLQLGAPGALPPWLVLFAVAVTLGLCAGVLAPSALVSLVCLAALARGAKRSSGAAAGALCALACCIALALSLHLLPGFDNPKLMNAIQISGDAQPLTKYINFDKGAAGLILLAAFASRVSSPSELKLLGRYTLIATCLTASVLMGVALAMGYVRLDIKLPPVTAAFLATNLFFTSVAEEAFFRGVVQERLMQFMPQRPLMRWVPVALSALLFGAAHAGGGSALVILATLGGVGYALVYFYTRRIEASVLVHFGVNAVHFLFFSYPALQAAPG